ncbi:hypothetical protein GCM10008905_00530 [Clostridium malenominatum]|uniref:Putative zinc-finger domain-containing protein n=1 Tax=Clostridium malenominatum TaxID=1539 RepID=A0ABN1IKN5_9CLOT
MNCNIVTKKIYDFLEGSVSHDLHEAIENHLKECESCRSIYEEEKALEELIKASLSVEDIEFKSSRAEIMKSIDKDRYGKGFGKKLIFHFKKYNKQYLASVACLALFISMSPLVKNKSNVKVKMAAEDSSRNADMQKSFNMKNIEVKEMALDTTAFFSEQVQFSKEEVKDEKSINFNTPWVESPNKTLSASIEGRGPYGGEEGIATVVIKDSTNKKTWKYSLIPGEKQITPKYIQWLDDENLFVIIGFPFGTISRGGNLYLLNVPTDKNYIIYETGDDKKEVTSLQKINREGMIDLKLELNVYEDDEFNKSHKETVTLENFKVIFDK